MSLLLLTSLGLRTESRYRTSLQNRGGGTAVKGGPSGPAEGSPGGATLTAVTATPSLERVRERSIRVSETAGAFAADDVHSARLGAVAPPPAS